MTDDMLHSIEGAGDHAENTADRMNNQKVK